MYHGLDIPKTQSILCLYSVDASARLYALKKLLVATAGANAHLYRFIFAKTGGLTIDTFQRLVAAHDWTIVSCPFVAETLLLSSMETAIGRSKISINSAAGSIYKIAGKSVLIIPELEQLHTTDAGQFLCARYLEKIFAPQKWIDFPPFKWERLETEEVFQKFYFLAQHSVLCSVDIETTRELKAISCIGFSILTVEGQIFTGVLDARDEHYFSRIRALLSLPVLKVFQNGLYDNLYLLRWNSPTTNWAWDTSYAFHAWYSELDKDLGFLSAFFIRDFQYWKTDGRNAQTKEEYHRYNAKDCYATLCVCIAQMREMPQWAKDNFVINFPRVFPCLLMNAQGLAVCEQRRKKSHAHAVASLESGQQSLCAMTANPDFNANSWQQVQKLLACFRIQNSSTDEKSLVKAGLRHPILARVLTAVLAVRENAKAVNQYFDPELFHGRLYFNMHPAGTVTGRFACQKSSFWCGAQIQNYPPYAKSYIQAESGYVFVEIDNEQSETRCTAYMAQDGNLIATVESGKDFHSMNATVFFGVPYEVARKKQEDGSDSPPRALAKRINHAVSYNMEEVMFVEQAGEATMRIAQGLLNLPAKWVLREIARHLIGLFNKNYPRVRGEFQAEIKRAIAFTKRLTSPSFVSVHGRPLTWTRRFFGNPSIHKPALNAAVAHGPQNLSVQIVNEALMVIYEKILFLPGRPVLMSAQMHDSILFQIREEELDRFIALLQMHLCRPLEIHGRILVIPTAAKITGQYWGKQKSP